MATKAMVDRLKDLNKILVGRLKEKEEEMRVFREKKYVASEDVEKQLKEVKLEVMKRLETVWEKKLEDRREEYLEFGFLEGRKKERGEWEERQKVWETRLEVEKARKVEQLRTPSPDRENLPSRPKRKGSPVRIEDMVDELLGGKKRKIEEKRGKAFDPEKAKPFQVKVGVKVGGVLWEDGVDGVLVGLREMGFTICEGSRWLVNEKERDKRRENGKTSSTVLAMIGGGARAAGELCRSGIWVGARWCSVKRFVAIPPRRVESGWKRELKGVARGVEKKLEDVAKVAEELLDDAYSMADMKVVKKKRLREKKDKEKEVEMERILKGRKGKGKGKEVMEFSDEGSGMGDGDWKFDRNGKLVSAGGLSRAKFTKEGWEREEFMAKVFCMQSDED